MPDANSPGHRKGSATGARSPGLNLAVRQAITCRPVSRKSAKPPPSSFAGQGIAQHGRELRRRIEDDADAAHDPALVRERIAAP